MFLILVQKDGSYTVQGQPLSTDLIEPSFEHMICVLFLCTANLHPLFLVFMIVPPKNMAGLAGFEPANEWVKAICLAAWLQPSIMAGERGLEPR